jgi:nitrite reductase/ring-hydroxylating ferredoxin subunit
VSGKRILLTVEQREQAARGRFVSVSTGGAQRVLVGRAGGAWRAYVNECRHRALPLDLGADSPMSDDGALLLCNQHGALYRPADGVCVVGPCAGEKLTPLDVREAGDELLVG